MGVSQAAAPPDHVLLLPAARRLAGALPPALAKRLGRADPVAPGAPGLRAQLQRHVSLRPAGAWPEAALTRQLDAGDAHGHAWLRADPAHVRPDMATARLLAVGELGLTAEDVEDFLRPLKPVFGDAGFPLSAPVPHRWYLQLPAGAKLPAFSDPEDALGDDLFAHLPEGPEARRWRGLLSEAQVILHQHPRNAERAARGLPTVNSLWCFGGGALPDAVAIRHASVHTREALLAALAMRVGALTADGGVKPAGEGMAPVAREDVPAAWPADWPRGGARLVDLRGARALDALARDWLQPAVAAVDRGALPALQLDFADGTGLRITRGQRWRFWRAPLAALPAAPAADAAGA